MMVTLNYQLMVTLNYQFSYSFEIQTLLPISVRYYYIILLHAWAGAKASFAQTVS